MKQPERNWTKVGHEYTGTTDQRKQIGIYIARLEWLNVPKKGEKPLSVAMMPGENIKEAIKELKLPKVDQIAISHDMAPFGFYAIRAHYKNGTAVVYIVDEGSQCVPICSDFWPKTPALAKSIH